MKTLSLLNIMLLLLISNDIFSQGIINNGATITINENTNVLVIGNYLNLTNISSVHGQIDLEGNLYVSGDFSNQSTNTSANVFINNLTDGTVIFNGTGDQHINNSLANAFINFENVIVNSGSNTFLDAGSAINVNGNLTVNGIFTLSSPNDEGESGSLITNTSGTVSGTGTLNINRFMKTAGRYVYFSAPVDNATDDQFTTAPPGYFNPNLYHYNESYNADPDPVNTDYSNWASFYNAWVQDADEGSTITLDGGGRGYITYSYMDQMITFGGSTPDHLNNSEFYNAPVSYTFNDGNGGYYDGWNLVGNPYPCALDWDNINWGKTDISNTLYMWDGDAGNYIYYNNASPDDHLQGSGQTLNYIGDARYIPAMQAFMVKTSGVPVLTIPDDARLHYQKDMYKDNEKGIVEFDYLRLKTEYNEFQDETIIRFLENAQDGVDMMYDAYKMFPTNAPAMIYSLVQNSETPLAINSLPIKSIGTVVPLGFISAEEGSYTISVNEFEFNPSTKVTFFDTQYNESEQIVYNGFEYSFTHNGGEVRDRFYLFFSPEGQTEIENNTKLNSLNIWSFGNRVYISLQSEKNVQTNVEIFDILGKPVLYKQFYGNSAIFQVPVSAGTYIVKVNSGNGISETKQLFIQK